MNKGYCQKVIKDVLDDNPDLTEVGFNSYKMFKIYNLGKEMSDGDIKQKVLDSQAKLTNSHEEFILCVEYLKNLSNKTLKSYGSYTLKHVIEKDVRTYITNGVLITAAIYLGLSVEKSKYNDNPNAIIVIPPLVKRGVV